MWDKKPLRKEQHPVVYTYEAGLEEIEVPLTAENATVDDELLKPLLDGHVCAIFDFDDTKDGWVARLELMRVAGATLFGLRPYGDNLFKKNMFDEAVFLAMTPAEMREIQQEDDWDSLWLSAQAQCISAGDPLKFEFTLIEDQRVFIRVIVKPFGSQFTRELAYITAVSEMNRHYLLDEGRDDLGHQVGNKES